jgi:nucleoside-diphosphate-sugar epimerase
MKLFVTGGTGFIGSTFIERALSVGNVVIAQRRVGSRSRLTLTQEPLWVDRELDKIFDVELSGCDAVVHLASHTPNVPYAPLSECLYWNVCAMSSLMQQAVTQGVRDFIIAGTYFEYGAAANGQDFVHPATELRPIMTYPISKAAASTACLGLARLFGLRLQVLRIFHVYGEGELETRFWPSLRSAAISGRDFEMSTGAQIRDFIEVSEVVSQLLSALSFEGVEPGRPQIRNIGTGRAQTLLEFASRWWVTWGATGQIIPGKITPRAGELDRIVANVEAVHIC